MFLRRHTNRDKKFTRAGISVLEVILSVAIFGVIAASVLKMVWEPLVAVGAAEQRGQAVFLAQEGLDAARSIRNSDWLALTDGNHGIEQSGGVWQFAGSNDVSDEFTRTISVASVYRDPAGNIIESGGTLDSRSKRITSTVTWDTLLGYARSAHFTSYLTNWNVYDWVQTTDTDFGGGTVSDAFVSDTGTAALVQLALDPPAETWTLLDRVEDKKIFAVDGAAADDVWAGGEGGNLYRYDGLSWSEVTSPTNVDINGISAAATDDVHLVTKNDGVYRWNGSSWSQSSVALSQEIFAVSAVSSSFAVAVGKTGLIAHWNGSFWSEVSSPTSKPLYGVSMLSATDGFAVGQDGTVVRWNGSAWSLASFPTADDLWAVDYHSSGLAMTGSDQDNVFRWDGSSWNQESLPTTKKIYAVGIWSATEAWAAGESGAIVEWDGSSWTEYTSPVTDHLRAITPRGANGGWICGEKGRQLQYNPSDQYLSSGTFISSVLDTDSVLTEFGQISWTENLSGGSSLTNVSDNRYFQYKAFFNTDDTDYTPELSSVSVGNGSGSVTHDDETDFNSGNYASVAWYTSAVKLTPGTSPHSSSGTYESPVIDAGDAVSWNNLTWLEGNPYGEDLPDNQASESVAGGADMNGNVLLLHSNENPAIHGSSIADSSGQSNVCALNTSEGSTNQSVSGQYDQAIDFDGVDDYVDCDHDSSLNLTSAVTVEAWIKTSTTVRGWVAAKFGLDNIGGYGLAIDNDVVQFTTRISGDSYDDYEGTVTVTDGQWHHIVGTWNGSVKAIYVDGVLDVSKGHSGTLVSNADPLWVGRNPRSGKEPLSAVIDEVAIYSRDLNSTEILDRYQRGAVDLKFQVRSDDDDSGWGSFIGPDGTSGTYYTSSASSSASTDLTLATRTGNVATPDATWSAWSSELTASCVAVPSSDARYLQYRATFSTTDNSYTPELHDVTVTYSP